MHLREHFVDFVNVTNALSVQSSNGPSPSFRVGGTQCYCDDNTEHRPTIAGDFDSTYLENRFRMRPLGVVSKNVMGERMMACAILSCNLREACQG